MTRASRRDLLKLGLGLFGGSLLPAWVPRALAAGEPRRRRVLVVLFQRGAVDGLSMAPPVGDPAYFAARPGLALARPGPNATPRSGTADPGTALRLDDLFGLHPALSALHPLYQAGRMAVVQEAGLTLTTRSHFDAQDWMECGRGVGERGDGVLNRTLTALHPPADPAPRLDRPDAETPPPVTPFQAVAIQPNMPRILAGGAPALAFPSLDQFRLRGANGLRAAASFESMYASAVDTALRVSGAEAFDALSQVSRSQLAQLPPENGARYPPGPLGQRLQDIARLIHADLGLTVAVTEAGGWDTHVNQKPQLETRLSELGDSLASFAQDLGPRLDDVCLLTLTEFGRTVRENGNRGTDHGRASAFFVIGGGVHGGRVLTGHGGWRGLEVQHLFEGRDLDVRWDYRAVLATILEHHLGVPPSARADIFPGLGRIDVPGLFG